MKIQTYNYIKLMGLDKTPVGPQIHQFCCDLTMKKADDIAEKKASSALYDFLIDAEHTSILEHSSMTFLARGLSRSLLAQVTRQRTFSFTSASQHYQDYRDYPMSLRPGWNGIPLVKISDANNDIPKLYRAALEHALDSYIKLVEAGEKPEEARQVLPNACTVNLVITANPRALALFLRQRLCKRNTQEMLIFAKKLHDMCMGWIPDLFQHIGPPCFMNGACNQGKLSCKKS